MSAGGSNLLSWPTQEGWRADYWSTPSGAELELTSLRTDEAPRFCALLLSCVPRKQDNSPPPGGPRRFSIMKKDDHRAMADVLAAMIRDCYSK